MPQPKQTREQRLAQFKISLDRYQMECRGLVSEGFSPEQADRLIIRGSSYKTVQSVLNNCRDLLVAPYHLTQEQLTTIAGHDGGSKNIEAVQRYFQELRVKGHSMESIAAIASRNGGSGAIRSAVAHDFRAFLVSLGAIPTTNTIMPLASMRLFSSRDDASLSANADDDEPMDSPQPNKRRKFSTNGVRLD